MKKRMPLTLIFIIVLAMFTFTGCSTTDDVETDDGTSIEFTYSDGIDNNGFWQNIVALDYVELCDYEGILIPSDIHVITEESIQTVIDYILSDYTYDEQVTNRSVTDGDTVNID